MIKIIFFGIFTNSLCTNNPQFKHIIKNNIIFPTLYSRNDLMSLEHIYPKHLLNISDYNDYHNIYSASKKINNLRSNYIFCDNKNIKWDIKIDNNYISNKHKLFMPREKDRGIIARSMLYMTYKYNYSIIMNKKTICNWCLKYEPNINEKLHNLYIKTYFGYDNPFISKYYDKNYLTFVNKILN